MKLLGKVALIVAVAILAVSGLSFAAEKGIANGKVTAVSDKAVTVAGANGATWTFEVAQGARVVGTGASHKTRALESTGKLRTMDNFVREGQRVSVRYEEKGGTLYLTQLRVL
jgi:hypothetical protein